MESRGDGEERGGEGGEESEGQVRGGGGVRGPGEGGGEEENSHRGGEGEGGRRGAVRGRGTAVAIRRGVVRGMHILTHTA